MMENDATSTLVELRPRNRGNGGFSTSSSFVSGNNPTASTSWAKEDDKVFIEHAVQPTDSLYKIGLLYSVPVSEIRRVNNIVADQEIYGLKLVRVPVTRLRQQLLNEKAAAMQTSTSNEAPIIDVNSASTTPQVAIPDKIKLLGDSTDDDDQDEDGKEPGASHKSAIEAYLNKADSTMAHCRSQLPSPSLESGAFHFVNASAPDNTIKGTWMLVIGVVIMFVVVPLFLTMLEENHENHHHDQVHKAFSST